MNIQQQQQAHKDKNGKPDSPPVKNSLTGLDKVFLLCRAILYNRQ